MEQLKKYHDYINDIDKIKEMELRKGLTQKCKLKIDEVYSEICEGKDELELELYRRKSYLLNEIKNKSNLYYDMIMSLGGAFFGFIVGYYFQGIMQLFNDSWIDLKERIFWQLNPMKIINGDIINDIVIFFIMIGGLLALYKMHGRNKKDELHVFQIDMGNYEIQKIDEILKNF